MKEYSEEERTIIINRINQMQKFKRKYKQEKKLEPTQEDIISGINITKKQLDEINSLLAELEKQDEEYKLEKTYHTKEDIEKARQIRKNKKERKENQK